MGDTVIDMAWLQKLRFALECFYKKSNREAVITQLNEAAGALERLKARREHCSDYSKTRSEYAAFECELQKLMELLREAYE